MSMMPPPERPYTPYQRREVLASLIEEGQASDLTDAANKFELMEYSDLDTIRERCARYPKEPK